MMIQCSNGCGKEIQAKTIKAQCSECTIQKNKISKTIWRKNNYNKTNERNRKQYADNPEKSKQNVQKYHKNNPASHRYTTSKTKGLKRGYASIADYMTREEFINWYDLQPKQCAVCGDTENWCIDHDHETGRPRGILCVKHNVIEGRIGTIEDAEALVRYMKDNREHIYPTYGE